MKFTLEEALKLEKAIREKWGESHVHTVREAARNVAIAVFSACQKEIEEINNYREKVKMSFNEKVRELHIADGIISDQQKEIERLKSSLREIQRQIENHDLLLEEVRMNTEAKIRAEYSNQVQIIGENREKSESMSEELKFLMSLQEACERFEKNKRSSRVK